MHAIRIHPAPRPNSIPATDTPANAPRRLRDHAAGDAVAHLHLRRHPVTGRLGRMAAVALCALSACTPPPRPAPVPPPPPPPPAPPPGPPPFTATEVWTTQPGLVLRVPGRDVTLPWTFT